MAEEHEIKGIRSLNQTQRVFVIQGSGDEIAAVLQNKSSEVLQFCIPTDGQDGFSSWHDAPDFWNS